MSLLFSVCDRFIDEIFDRAGFYYALKLFSGEKMYHIVAYIKSKLAVVKHWITQPSQGWMVSQPASQIFVTD